MLLDTEVGLDPGDFVLDVLGDKTPLPNFRPVSLWPNGWMDQDGAWHGRGPCSRPRFT